MCEGTVFHILQDKGPSYLQNRYKLGRIQQGRLLLNRLEATYLFLKGKILPENTLLNRFDKFLERMEMDSRLIDIYIVYSMLKNRGFYVKMENDSLFYRRSPRVEYRGPVMVIRESGEIDFRDMVENGSCIYAAIDDDNDVTVFISEIWDGSGENVFQYPDNPDMLENDGLVAIKALQVPEWFGAEFGEYRLLNRLEANLLAGQGKVAESDETQRIYNDLIGRNFIVKTGFKYGSNFRIYSRAIEDHADFLVHVIGGREQWYKISRAVRVAQGVKKEMIFSGLVDDSLAYVGIRRVRDPFSSEA